MSITQKYSEQELVSLLQQRQESSFGYLYDNYAGALLGVVGGIVADQETARDVLQEVFVNIWRKIELYDPAKGRLFTWMMNIARNAAIDKIRSKGYQDSLKNHSIPENADQNFPATGPQVDDVGLRKVLNQLKEEHRVLVDLSYFQGYTHDEISKALNIPLGTVKTRIRSALIHLRTLIKQ
ncbi:sigma-70 family RNA polymerase sigma factor [Terrimonas sp. NA20]|uniref:Sigma-70 family RNA polymerase sigma factor n=1 Tax=Terrimonas ginsenosidimutans TaxID=2908004 RepID=A0ABS9KQC9_9BACT|nr:sigma-70 family RNA polymerase sigma factor [Terrimonas ginsenosidimutans]MCG2614475.1 sigma-70 family RNA polymerase sigma factor [Terrimonas ginsenosidimutans]